MGNIPLRRILAASLLLISLVNSGRALREFYHWPLPRDDQWTLREKELSHAKTVLNELPERHIEYRLEEASSSYDPSAFYQLQNILAPSILQQGATRYPFVLVEFWTTRQTKPIPDLILLEDLGHGLGLYRRRSS